jgi:hypothetical protein
MAGLTGADRGDDGAGSPRTGDLAGLDGLPGAAPFPRRGRCEGGVAGHPGSGAQAASSCRTISTGCPGVLVAVAIGRPVKGSSLSLTRWRKRHPGQVLMLVLAEEIDTP